jgi:hypothetical protein
MAKKTGLKIEHKSIAVAGLPGLDVPVTKLTRF